MSVLGFRFCLLFVQGNGPEKLVSGSDDFTLFLWEPEDNKKPLARMTGLISQTSMSSFCHTQAVF